jgi:histidinol dehydrogenase
VGIDMLAGPSELVICADDSADPEILAADLLAQAEHDDDAVPILVSTSDRLIHKVGEALHRQLATLPTGATAARALANGAAIPAADLDEAVRICDSLAPEHLEIITREAALVARRITSAGAIFIGPASAEVLGDYGAGPNHVLPTGRSARFRAGLSVFTFLRARTFLLVDSPDRAGTLYTDAADLARIEGLEAHARAAELRIGGVRPDGSPRPGAIR